MNKPRYKTWIRTRLLLLLSILTAVSVLLSLLSVFNRLFAIFVIPAGAFGYILLLLALAKWRFSESGGNYQSKIHRLIASRAEGGRILDIGCGSGHLLSLIARRLPESELVGIDYWGGNWEYSKELCIRNFKAENIRNKVEFRKETASNLPEDIGMFDCVVSCMTFHEVRDVGDKTVSIREALKHLKPGGKFVFIDLFRSPMYYPDYGKIDQAIASRNGVVTERAKLSELLDLPFPLKHRQALGYAELIAGRMDGA
jgi:Methylase involved in ubiquinone/menaquinone biosynthesis